MDNRNSGTIKRAITVYVPGNVCNFRCSYCYVSECLRDGHEQAGHFNYSVEHMVEAFRPERIGGNAHITVIGAGETLIPPEVVPFVKGLLHLGHVVELVTNNTLNQRIDELLDTPREDIGRLIVKCSLHWKELKRLHKVEDYFNNIKRIIAAGASSYPFLVICDEYMNELDEIIDICKRELGAVPQCSPCVTAETRADFLKGGVAMTSPACTPAFVKEIDKKFHSKLFEQSVRFLDVDVKRVFCYAGKWSLGVGMGDGVMCKCHNVGIPGNFFENIEEPYIGEPVGCECGIASCCLQYGFYALGLIPEIPEVPTYTEMVCGGREHLFSEEVKALMNVKIGDSEEALSDEEKMQFLMRRMEEKDADIQKYNELIVKYNTVLNDYKQRYEPSSQQLVESLLNIIDEDILDEEHVSRITYGHIIALRQICNEVNDGQRLYTQILKKLYGVIVEKKYYKESFVCCDIKESMHYIDKLPLSVLVIPGEKIEDVEYILDMEDVDALVDFFWKEFEHIL